MPLTPSLRPAVNSFEDAVIRELGNLSHQGFVTNTVLLPNVDYRFYPDEHDALLLLPWAAYTIDAKEWNPGTYRFPMNNPVEYHSQQPPADPSRGWRRQANLPNPFHVAKQKGSALHAYCRHVHNGLERYPVLPLIVLPDRADFFPVQHTYTPTGGGPAMNLRIVKLGQMNATINGDAGTGAALYGPHLLEGLLRRLEAEPRRPFEGLALCGFLLEQRADRHEPGCPVRLVTYLGKHAGSTHTTAVGD